MKHKEVVYILLTRDFANPRKTTTIKVDNTPFLEAINLIKGIFW